MEVLKSTSSSSVDCEKKPVECGPRKTSAVSARRKTGHMVTLELTSIKYKNIYFYVDGNHNVYDTEDVLCGAPEPRILSKYKRNEDGEIEFC